MIHIDVGIGKNCWNLYDSYGEICVGCGCCSSDKKTRYESRKRCIENWIKEHENFSNWSDDPYWKKVQKQNIKSDIRLWKKQLRYYTKKLAEMGC